MNENDLNAGLMVPEFSRLHDWLGVWSMEPMSFETMVEALKRVDLVAHVRASEGVKIPVRSQLEKTPPDRNGGSIAIIKVVGTLMKSQSSFGGTSTVQLRRDIRQAASDPDVTGILLAIDSPGGTTAGTHDLAAEVKAARRTKPVVAQIDDMGASAAYWPASQADAIYASNPTTMVGSIGTYATVYDYSEMFGKEGIKTYNFATGPLKGMGTPGTIVTEEQRAHWQDIVEQSQKSFDDAVRLGRGMSAKELADVRTGAVWIGENAISKKLIDGIQSMSKTIDDMRRGKIKAGGTSSSGALSGDGSNPGNNGVPPVLSGLPMLKDNN